MNSVIDKLTSVVSIDRRLSVALLFLFCHWIFTIFVNCRVWHKSNVGSFVTGTTILSTIRPDRRRKTNTANKSTEKETRNERDTTQFFFVVAVVFLVFFFFCFFALFSTTNFRLCFELSRTNFNELNISHFLLRACSRPKSDFGFCFLSWNLRLVIASTATDDQLTRKNLAKCNRKSLTFLSLYVGSSSKLMISIVHFPLAQLSNDQSNWNDESTISASTHWLNCTSPKSAQIFTASTIIFSSSERKEQNNSKKMTRRKIYFYFRKK